MQPTMVARGYQNPLSTHNSCLGTTFWEDPLPWNVNIPGGKDASWNMNSTWIYPSYMGGISPGGHPLIYTNTVSRGNPLINSIP